MAKLSIRIMGLTIGSILCFQLIHAMIMPWDGFIIQSKPIIGNATQYQTE